MFFLIYLGAKCIMDTAVFRFPLNPCSIKFIPGPYRPADFHTPIHDRGASNHPCHRILL